MASILFRITVALNFFRFALSFWPRFEGTDADGGIADRLFNPFHHSGFRIDFVWLVISTFVVCLVTVLSMASIQKERRARINAVLGLSWMIAFAVYIVRSLTGGILYFG
jgi:hypothetical protein